MKKKSRTFKNFQGLVATLRLPPHTRPPVFLLLTGPRESLPRAGGGVVGEGRAETGGRRAAVTDQTPEGAGGSNSKTSVVTRLA